MVTPCTSRMRLSLRCTSLAAALALCCNLAAAQSSAPLGARVVPKEPVELGKKLDLLLPVGSVCRMYVRLEAGGDEIVVYDASPKAPIYNPHIAVIRRGVLIRDFKLAELDEWSDSYVFVDGISLGDGGDDCWPCGCLQERG